MHLVIDTDTAGDDVVALMVALLTPGVEVHGITINCGNVDFDHQVENALKTVEVTGHAGQVPVFPGARNPLLREWVSAAYVHGQDGMGESYFDPVAQRPEARHAVDFLLEASHRYDKELTIIGQAPLTNLALAVRQDPGFAGRIKALFVMGGTNNSIGNVFPLSEYNFFVDPEAARIVFQAGFNLRLVTWDVCLQDSLVTRPELERLRALDTPLARFFLATQRKVWEFNHKRAGIDGTTHPDAITVACAIDETLWQEGFSAFVDVETVGELTRGASVMDTVGAFGRPPNTSVCTRADGARFRDALFSMLKSGSTGLPIRGRDWTRDRVYGSRSAK